MAGRAATTDTRTPEASVVAGMSMRVGVTVDDREPVGVVEAVRDHPDVADVRVERLDSGDLVVESRAVER